MQATDFAIGHKTLTQLKGSSHEHFLQGQKFNCKQILNEQI